jgi:D-amino-acid oxidase
VIGLTTAAVAQEAGFRVTVYTDRPPTHTTSTKAAASVKPTDVPFDERTLRVLATSWEEFARIATDYPAAGVRKHVHWEASSATIPRPWYLDVMEHARQVERPDVPGGYAFAWSFETFFVDTPIFLPWLTDRLAAAGGELRMQTFQSLDELAALPHDVVFNCTGLGARALCGDEAMAPVRGQIVLVGPQPNMDWSIRHDGFYVYPRRSDTVLGGTNEPGMWEETAESGTIQTILRASLRILPHLTPADIQGSYAGLRPFRAGGIRIEPEQRGGRTIVHNYGHAGAGITLCWGSAREAVGLVV